MFPPSVSAAGRLHEVAQLQYEIAYSESTPQGPVTPHNRASPRPSLAHCQPFSHTPLAAKPLGSSGLKSQWPERSNPQVS